MVGVNLEINGVASSSPKRSTVIMPMVVMLFFAWGFVTVLNDPLIAKLKGLFSLTYAEAMLIQFAFFLGYFIFSIPSGIVLGKLGYARSITLGLVIMAVGCLMFAPAAMIGTFSGFLIALFCVAGGITMLQVAANPYIAMLGPAETSHSRLTLAQAFNSLGTFVGPFVGAMYLLQRGVEAPTAINAAENSALRLAEAELLLKPFLMIAVLLLLFAFFFWMVRNVKGPKAAGSSINPFSRRLLARPRLVFGVLAIFLYVGAEVSIGSGLTNYLMQDTVVCAQAGAIGASVADMLFRLQIVHDRVTFNAAQIAGSMVSIYWGLAMVGRFLGAAVLAKVTPGWVLACNALAALVLALLSAGTTGIIAAAAVLTIGLANSVMFPTIFTLALEDLGEDTAKGSALLCMAIVGGAIIPVIYGAAADRIGLGHALIVPAACYLLIVGYGWFAARARG